MLSKNIFTDKWEEDLYKVKKAYKKDDVSYLNNLLKKLSRPTRVGRKGSKSFSGGNAGFFEPTRVGSMDSKQQRVTFKMTYSNSKQAHDKYLNTYMTQQNREEVTQKPVLFGTDADVYNENQVDNHFKCIISPENQNADLEILTRTFVKHLEAQTGYKFYWQAAIHNNTEHKHAHLCINGKDQNGKDVYFQKEMIKRTMRETLSNIATKLLGNRTEEEIQAGRKNLITAMRWTELDERIKNSASLFFPTLDSVLQNRIAFLIQNNLASKNDENCSLREEWEDVLKATGRYNTYFEKYQKLNGNLELYSGGSIIGKVVDLISFDKDESWNDALIINDGQKNIYVPIYQLQKEDLIGKTVSVKGGNRKLARQIKNSDIRVLDENKTIQNLKNKNIKR